MVFCTSVGEEKKHIWEGVLLKLVYYLLFIRKKNVYYLVKIIIMDIFKRLSLKTLSALRNHEGRGGNGMTK